MYDNLEQPGRSPSSQGEWIETLRKDLEKLQRIRLPLHRGSGLKLNKLTTLGLEQLIRKIILKMEGDDNNDDW